MKKIIDEYGGAVVAFTLAVFIFSGFKTVGLIGNSKNVLEIFEPKLKEISKGVSITNINKKFDSVAVRKKPTVIYLGMNYAEGIEKDSVECIYDMFEAKDSNGEEASVSVLEIRDPYNKSVTGEFLINTGYFVFREAGVYHIKLKIQDKENVKSIKSFKIFVKES